MMSLQGVTTQPGRWGFKDLALARGRLRAGQLRPSFSCISTAPASTDATGVYMFTGDGPPISDSVSAVGGASAAFTGGRQGFGLRAPAGSMFSPGAVWGDFTIEFWLYPATMSDGENVLSWDGTERDSTAGSNQLLSQSLRCFIRDRKLVWDFQSLFGSPVRIVFP